MPLNDFHETRQGVIAGLHSMFQAQCREGLGGLGSDARRLEMRKPAEQGWKIESLVETHNRGRAGEGDPIRAMGEK